MSFRPRRAAQVKRSKDESRDRRAKQQEAQPPRPASWDTKSSAIIASLLAAGLIGYAGDTHELRTDMELCQTCRVPKLPVGNRLSALCLCRP